MSGGFFAALPRSDILTDIRRSRCVLRRAERFGKVSFMPEKALCGLLLMVLTLGANPGWAQSKINFKVIPILQPMKEAAPTPDFSLTDPEGKKISLKDFRGRTIFLNFWATWCEPCREEMPAMEKLYQEHKNNNFVVLAVNVKDRRQEALAFVKELKLTYPIVFRPQRRSGIVIRRLGATDHIFNRSQRGRNRSRLGPC